jgi:hypothetical protein
MQRHNRPCGDSRLARQRSEATPLRWTKPLPAAPPDGPIVPPSATKVPGMFPRKRVKRNLNCEGATATPWPFCRYGSRSDHRKEITVDEKRGIADHYKQVTEIGAGVVAFAYISGYLIVNTYLSSFGINGDAIQIFKSKYVYVGFLYILFLSGITLVFAVAKKWWDVKHMLQAPDPPTNWAEWVEARKSNNEVAKYSDQVAPDRAHEKLLARGFRLWVMAVALMVIPLNIELTLFNSTIYKHHMVIQFALLYSVILYQMTYYRVYRDHQWDRNSEAVFRLRRLCVGLELAFAILLWCTQWLHRLIQWYQQHWIYQALLFAATAMTLVWLFRPVFLSAAERIAWEENHGPAWTTDIFRQWRFRAFMFALCLGGLIAITAVKYWVRWWLTQYVGLLMAISVLGGVVILSIQANQRREREGPEHEATTSERWIRWILRVTVGTTLYLFSTFGFAYAIYSHIPVQKEGGDYTTGSVVRIVTDHEPFENMIVLSQDTTYLYAARVDKQDPPENVTAGKPLLEEACTQDYRCDPKHWRDGLLEQCGPSRPHVLAINQKEIRTIEETARVSSVFDCKDVLGK